VNKRPLAILLLSLAAATSRGAAGHWLVAAQTPKSPMAFDLMDNEGHRHNQREWRGKRAIILFFIESECPISTRYAPEMNRLASRYAARDFVFYGVESDPAFAARRAARQHLREFDYQFPILLDPGQQLARLAGITLTPEVAVLSDSGDLLYRGRIDDRYISLSKYRDHPMREDLRLALDAIGAGQPVPVQFTTAIGCYLFASVEKRARP